MNRKKRTILLTSIFSSIPLMTAGGYLGLKHSLKSGNSKIYEKIELNDKLVANAKNQLQSRNHISDFNFENEIPKIKPKKEPIPLEIPKTNKLINILEDKVSLFIPKKEKDKPQKIITAPILDVKPSNIPIPTPNPNPQPSIRNNTPSQTYYYSNSNSVNNTPKRTWSPNSNFKGGKTVKIYDLDLDAEYDEVQERKVDDSDSDIKNWKGYQALLVPGSVRVKVTEELISKTKEAATKAIKGLFPENIREGFKKDPKQPEARIWTVRNNWSNYYQNKFEKYERLFMSDNVKDFLTDEGMKKYKDIVSIEDAKKNHEKKIERFVDLFVYFDYSKVKGVSDQVKKYLEEGFYIEEDNSNVYINENGILDSYSFTPTYNTVTSRLLKDNEERRAFGFQEYWPVAPGAILDNKIPGWTKSGDLSSTDEFKDFGISSAEGVTIYKQTKDANNKADNKSINGANEGLVLDIDAQNTAGFSKTKDIIKKLEKAGKKITQYRITNVGLLNEDSNFEDILKALPKEFPQLTLILEGPNTKFLRHLEEKKIDQLDLFTTKNVASVNGKTWSINPWSLKGVAWVNTNDYNASFDYNKYATIASRIVFDSLSFDQEDITKEGDKLDLTRINKGLRMAYYVRNNEGIFQGGFGSGLNPDHNEGNNSYPIELDLSRTELKSLRGLVFHDIKKPNNKSRKLRKLTLQSTGEKFEIDANELNEANLDVLDTVSPGPPATEIRFSNTSTKHIKIKGNSSLNSSGYHYLNMFMRYGHISQDKKIFVENTSSQLASDLKNHGFSVEQSTTNEPKLN
ncbi:putative immunoglobulin-blocking virulence protein [Mycoplasma phocimorsus]|uniref:putative immunoglobulin-blocking virulence protein n=1 Tax=Mycoplasma phocimorsus TaxID=3045839 RepID=UPI0024BFEE9A|nr:putative immunoglobulin-blocking virulence protein [Mycoplasma phocimorsus]MDJ1647141.1 putative immunoglobulin-blocking virulence protein [Mycoplasma phocimorsus]